MGVYENRRALLGSSFLREILLFGGSISGVPYFRQLPCYNKGAPFFFFLLGGGGGGLVKRTLNP